MGWNAGYTIFEATVIGAYDLGKLDYSLLSVLMEPYRDTDIDSGGERDLRTEDGKGVRQVVIETAGLAMPTPPTTPLPKWREDFTPEEEKLDHEWNDYHEAVYDLFKKVTDRFGWW